MASETLIAWAAGFFDGEGYIGTSRNKRNGKSIQLQMAVVQAGTEDEPPDTLIRFQQAVGSGRIDKRRSNKGRLGTKALWSWRNGTSDEAEAAFRLLLPFLGKAKMDQGAGAIALRHEWQGLFADRRRFCKRGHEYTPENIYTYINRPTPARLCRACARERNRELKARRRAQGIPLAAVEGAG